MNAFLEYSTSLEISIVWSGIPVVLLMSGPRSHLTLLAEGWFPNFCLTHKTSLVISGLPSGGVDLYGGSPQTSPHSEVFTVNGSEKTVPSSVA